MYSYIKGTLEEINNDSITVECNDIGYKIYATRATFADLFIGSKIKVYLQQIVREDELSLYGFSSLDEKNMFLKLISVSGVGPKSALAMLSDIGPSNIALAIVTGDAKSLTKVSGIGIKIAQRLILELKGNIDNDEFMPQSNYNDSTVNDDIVQEAITAIMALGFTRSEAVKSVGKVKNFDSVEDIIRCVLQNMDSSK